MKRKYIEKDTNMLKKMYSMLALVVMLIMLMVSCSEASEQNQVALSRSVTVSIGQANSRTLLPSAIVEPDYYTVTLTQKQQDDSNNWVTVPNSTLITGTIAKDETSVTLDNVMIGSYEVTVEGYKGTEGSAVLVMKNASGQIATITPTGDNKITVALELVTDSGVGSVEVKFDWTDVYYLDEDIKNATDNGTIKIEMYFKKDLAETTYELKGTATPDASQTEFTFTADNVPVTTSGMAYFKFYANNILIIDNYKIAAAQIYSGHVSTPDANETEVYKLTQNDVTRGKNVSNVKWEYKENDGSTAVIKWDNVVSRKDNNSLLNEVYLLFKDNKGSSHEATANADTGETGSYDFKMQDGVEYTLSVQARFKSGRVSNLDEVNFTTPLKSKVFVTGIEITGIPEAPVAQGEKITLSAKIYPENATFQGYTWSEWNSDILSGDTSSNTFTALKPGKTNITVTSTDDTTISKTSTQPIMVKLSAPENVNAEADNTGINVTWNPVDNASSYAIIRTVNGTEEATEINVGNVTLYTDKDLFAGRSYSYSVVAKNDSISTDAGFDVSSDSTTTAKAITINGTAIEITKPTLVGTTIDLGIDTRDYYYVSSTNKLSLSINEIDGAEYAWLINGIPVKSGKDSAAREFSVIGTEEEISDETYWNTLTIVVTKDTKSYSKGITFTVVKEYVEDTALTLSVLEGSARRLSSNLADGSNRTVHLVPSFDPSNATDKSVTYTSSNERIATVTANGTVTFVGEEFGKVTITGTSYSGHTDSIEFDVYKATVTSALELLNIVNSKINSVISASGITDWWTTDTSEKVKYSKEGFSIAPPYTTGQKAGHITIKDSSITSDSIGTIKLNTTEAIELEGEDSTWWISSDQKLLRIGENDNGTISIELPYNQGTAEIHYNNINVLGNTRSGTYTVTFSNVNGIDGSIETNPYSIPDAEGVTRPYSN